MMLSAAPLAATPGSIDSTVSIGSYPTPHGSSNASMPMKCMPQMPPPMLTAPATVQASRPRALDAARMRPDTDKATNADNDAMASDSTTSPTSYVPEYGGPRWAASKNGRKDWVSRNIERWAPSSLVS